jgi:hypothetical protein
MLAIAYTKIKVAKWGTPKKYFEKKKIVKNVQKFLTIISISTFSKAF